MRIPRFYQNKPLTVDAIISVDENAMNHATRVLRLQLGASLILFNGQGGEYTAVITEIKKNFVAVKIQQFIDRSSESPLTIHLGQGIARGDKMDFIIQKAVELGVHSITPLFTDHCNVQLEGERLAKKITHWQNVAISASEQSGRTLVPHIYPAQTVYQWIASTICNSSEKFILDPHAEKTLRQTTSVIKQTALLIGPEGGFSDAEIQKAQEHQFNAIKLGPRILRTETAALTIIAAMQSHWGDL